MRLVVGGCGENAGWKNVLRGDLKTHRLPVKRPNGDLKKVRIRKSIAADRDKW